MGEQQSEDLREFIGFVWPKDDLTDQSGVLVMARTSAEARLFVGDAFGEGFGISVWNKEDAARPR